MEITLTMDLAESSIPEKSNRTLIFEEIAQSVRGLSNCFDCPNQEALPGDTQDLI
jgi:hypothetical protein